MKPLNARYQLRLVLSEIGWRSRRRVDGGFNGGDIRVGDETLEFGYGGRPGGISNAQDVLGVCRAENTRLLVPSLPRCQGIAG